MATGLKEKRFLDALESLFTGAEVEGDSGFVNLMRMKRDYFRSIRPKLMERIDKRAGKDTAFREELFDKLYTFFSCYFCESGSIYFRHLKLAHAVQPGKSKNKLEIKLNNLYPGIDIAESLSNALGKPIRHRTANDVTFADGTTEKTSPAKMTEKEKQHFIALIKPYLWWGE